MILVTLGTQKFQMNRLVEAADKLAGQTKEDIYIQTGNSTYEPKHCRYSAFIDAVTYKDMICNCDVLITHSGVGSVMTGINAGKPVIVVPRLKAFHEHVDDHQLEIAKAFEKKGCVLCCEEVERLAEYVERARKYAFQPYVAPERKIENMVIDFLEAN